MTRRELKGHYASDTVYSSQCIHHLPHPFPARAIKRRASDKKTKKKSACVPFVLPLLPFPSLFSFTLFSFSSSLRRSSITLPSHYLPTSTPTLGLTRSKKHIFYHSSFSFFIFSFAFAFAFVNHHSQLQHTRTPVATTSSFTLTPPTTTTDSFTSL